MMSPSMPRIFAMRPGMRSANATAIASETSWSQSLKVWPVAVAARWIRQNPANRPLGTPAGREAERSSRLNALSVLKLPAARSWVCATTHAVDLLSNVVEKAHPRSVSSAAAFKHSAVAFSKDCSGQGISAMIV